MPLTARSYFYFHCYYYRTLLLLHHHLQCALPRLLVPGSSSGVTAISDIPCRMVLVEDPPGGNTVLQPQELAAAVEDSWVRIQPMLDHTMVREMAITGNE